MGIIFEALAAISVVESNGGYRILDGHRGPLLDPEHPDYAGAFVNNRAEEISQWTRLPEAIKSGEPVEDRTDASNSSKGLSPDFVERMRREALPSAEATAATLLPLMPDGARTLDVGGGPGAIAEALTRGGANVTVFDLPEVVDLVRERLERAGIRAEAGDMNESLPDGPFDAVYLGHTSHMYGARENRELFRRLYGVLAPGGLLAIRDFVRGESAGAEMFAVNMLVFTPSGGTYTAEEYRAWLEKAGFEGFQAVRVPGRDTHLVLGRRSEAGAD